MTSYVPQKAELLYHTPDPELMIVNAARVSHGSVSYKLTDKDLKLIQFLAKHEHSSPFRHVHFMFRLKMPLFVRAQFFKHRIGVATTALLCDDIDDIEVNEISRRYVKNKLEFYKPEYWRSADGNVKQGETPQIIDEVQLMEIESSFESFIENSYRVYCKLLDLQACQEQARMILPQNLMTECVVTFSFQSLQHLFHLRLKPNAQKEIQELAQLMKSELECVKMSDCLKNILYGES